MSEYFCTTCQPKKDCICKELCICNSTSCKCFECNRRDNFLTNYSTRPRSNSTDWTVLDDQLNHIPVFVFVEEQDWAVIAQEFAPARECEQSSKLEIPVVGIGKASSLNMNLLFLCFLVSGALTAFVPSVDPGIELTLPTSFFDAYNPIWLYQMKQTFHHMKLEIPALDFKLPAVGNVKFTFGLLQCRDFIVSMDNKNGFYLIKDHLGLSIKFSVFCSTKATQSKNSSTKSALLGSFINLNITGSYFMGEMGFGYEENFHQIIPIMQKLDAAFDQIIVEDGKFANMVIVLLKRCISEILARAGKDFIRSVIPDILRSALNPNIQVPNGGPGQIVNLTLSVVSPPVVNQTGFYCRVRLDETGLSPFADLQDNTLTRHSVEDFFDDDYMWGLSNRQTAGRDKTQLTRPPNANQMSPFLESGIKLDEDPDSINLEKDDALVEEILRFSRGPHRSNYRNE